MSGLRLILLTLGVLLIVAIYIWGRAFGTGKRRPRNKRLPEEHARGPAADLPGDEDIDYAEALADLDGLVKEARGAGAVERTESAPLGPAEGPAAAAAASSPKRGDAAPASSGRELIVVLFVAAQEGHAFSGPTLADAFAQVGLRFGEMDIYHHFGVGHMRPEHPVFSVANMFEPGTFDPQAMDGFATAGLALYTRLPQAVDGRVAFELMLNTAQRLAEQLGGRVIDEARKPLDMDAIERLRRRVGDFEDGRTR